MLNRIIEFSVKNKLIIGLMVIALIAYGIFQATKLPIDAVPDITDNQVQVITIAPSFGATDIERLVTFPIEQANSNISGMKEIRSFSRFGLSLVTIVFNDETNVYWARQQVAERLQQIQSQIPAGIGTPELGPVSSGLGEIYQYVVRPKKGYETKIDAIQLRTIQDWIVRRQLLGVEGVAEVSSFGGKLKQYEIAVNPAKLNAYGITINDIFDAVEANNQNTGGSYIEKGPTVLYIRSEGLIGSIADIESIAIPTKSLETPLLLRDVAEVKTAFATRYGAMCYNDEGEVSGAVVMMLKGANSNDVIKNVKQRIAQIEKTLPEGVTIEPFLDRTKMVNNAIGTVEKNLIEGALIVVFILVLFLGNLRAGLLVASVIPLAMLFAIIMMNLFGVSGNLMSLGALDFGLIVDGAVIIVEAVMHQLGHNSKYKHLTFLNKDQMNNTVTKSASKMMNSAVFGQIIILIVYLPIFTLQGIEGKMFRPMAQTVAFALLGAFILSLTYIPMMSSFFLSKKVKVKSNLSDRIMHNIETRYQAALAKVIQYPKLVLSSVLILFVSSIFVMSLLGGEFIPALEEGDFAVDTRVLTGSNLKTTIEFTQKAAHILKTRFPEVEKVVTKIGSGEVPTDPMPMEASDMMVILKDKKEWTSAKTFDELAEKMGDALKDVPGITAGFQYPVQMRFNELMTGARQDVVCKIFGENLDTLAHYAEQLGKIVNTVDGAQNLYVEAVTGMPQVIVEYNRPLIAQYHLSIAEINKIINTAFAGQSTGMIFEDEKRFDLVVRLDANERKNLEDVQNLLIPTPSGNQIPLNQLANVEIKNGPNQIQREDAKRRIVVGFNVRGRDVQSIVKELQQKIDAKVKFPTGYYVTYGGAFENLEQAKARLMIAVPVSLLLIFVLLFFAFNSVKQGLLIYSAIPLSAIGGIFFLALRGLPFSISAGIGFIALFGVAVLNGIVLIAEFNRQKEEGVASLIEIVLKGTSLRLRPVLMTAFVASLGFLPMALSNGAGAEVQRPLATVVIGGLLVATLLTLFVLPILYLLFEKGIKMKKVTIKTNVLILIFSLTILKSKSQSPINLEKAIEIGVRNNLNVKSERLKAEYAEALIETAKEMPKANTYGEFGQINSNYFDTKFGVSQSINLPAIYQKQRDVYSQEWKLSKLSVELKEYELKKEITKVYYEFQYYIQKKGLLLHLDSLYSNFFQKASLRLQKGESNILEKSTAELNKNAITLQLKQVYQNLKLMRLQFQYLLNEDAWLPQEENEPSFKVENLQHYPMLDFMQQQQEISKSITALQKTNLLPSFNIGYNNSSIRGVGADNKSYTSFHRFQTVQLGMEIPIFRKNIKRIIEASKLNEKISSSEFDRMQTQLNWRKKQLESELDSQNEMLEFIQNHELPNAKIIINTATKQFQNGDINYLDWVLLINQAIAIENNYIEAIRMKNENSIDLYFLTDK